MKIGIICAAEKEFAPFLPQIEGIKTSEKAMLQFYEGKIHGTEVAAVVSGVCKVNAAVGADSDRRLRRNGHYQFRHRRGNGRKAPDI